MTEDNVLEIKQGRHPLLHPSPNPDSNPGLHPIPSPSLSPSLSLSPNPNPCPLPGRHPLLHLLVSQQVPNDCALGREGARDDAAMEGEAGEAGEAGPPPPERLLLLTGPNASGKTVYLRTMALITYLAHVGSFVPAEAAAIGLTLTLALTLGLYRP